MTTINDLLGKYQKLECLFMTKEVTDFRKELEKFKYEQTYMISVLEATSIKENIFAAKILRNIVGRENHA